MKVVLFAPKFSPLTETFIYTLACEVRAAGVDVRVLTFSRENAESRPFEPVDVLAGSRTRFSARLQHCSTRLRGIARRLDFVTRWRLIEELRTYLRLHKPDIVHAHFADRAELLVRACNQVGVPIVVSLRGYDASRGLDRFRVQRRYRQLFQRTQAVILVSEEMRGRIAPLVPEGTPIRTIHAGKQPDQYAFRAPSPPIRQLISVGRLVEKKGHGDAIRAIGFARRSGMDVHLRIIGEGPLKSELDAIVREEQLEGIVEIRNATSHDNVIAALRSADAFILACRTARNGDREGVPNVLKEAQLVGLPVISTFHGGIPYVIPTANHRWLVHEGDGPGLGQLVSELAQLDQMELSRIAEAGRQHVATHFHIRDEVDRHLELYRSLLD